MILNGIFTITPSVVVIIAMILGLIAAIINGKQKHDLYIRENYLDDAGMRARRSSDARKAKREAAQATTPEVEVESETEESTDELATEPLKTVGFVVLAILLTSLFYVVGVVIVFLLYKYVANNALVQSKVAVKRKPSEKVPGGQVFAAIWKPLVGILAGIVILIFHPVSDLYYYGATLGVLALILWSFYDMVHLHNQLSSRPLPQFNRRGGDE